MLLGVPKHLHLMDPPVINDRKNVSAEVETVMGAKTVHELRFVSVSVLETSVR